MRKWSRPSAWLLLVLVITPVQIMGGKVAMAAPSVSQIIDTGQLALNGDGNARGYNDLYQFTNPGNTWELVGAWNFNNATHNSTTCSGASNSSGVDGPTDNSWGAMKFNALNNYGAGISGVLKTASNVSTGVTLSTEITKNAATLNVGRCSDVCTDTEYYGCAQSATAIRTARRTTQTIDGVSYIYPDRFFKLGAPALGTVDAQWSNTFSGLDPAGRYQFQFIYSGIRGMWENITSTASAAGANSTTSREVRLDTTTGLTTEINRYRNRITTEVMGADTYTLMRTQKSAQFPLVLNAFVIYRLARAVSTTTHSSAPFTPTYGNDITLNAQVTDGATGTVEFKDSALNTLCTTGALSNGVASCTWRPSTIGTYSVQATYAGDNGYKPSTSTAVNIVVGRAPLTIAASSPTVQFGDAVPTVTPSFATFVNGDSSNVVTGISCSTTYTTSSPVGSLPSSSCSGGTATNYSLSYTAGTVTVNPATQSSLTLAATSFNFGQTLSLDAGGGSGSGDFSYSLSSSGSAGCTRSGSTIAASSTGTCTVTVARDASGNYASKSQLFMLTVNPGDQSLLMIDDVRGTYGSALGLSTSGGSGTGAVSYAVITAGTAGCSVAVNGTDLLATNAGTCTVRATKAASVNHNVRTSTDATITFDKIAQPSSLAMADTNMTFGTTLTLAATGGNGGGALSYDVSAPGTAGCSISGATTLSVSAGGSCTVLVTRASSTNYLSRNDSFSITASRANQATLSIADVNGTYGEAFLLSTTGGSGTGAVSYAVTSTGSAGCAYMSGAITVSSVGTCAITATKASDNSYNLKTTSTTTLTFSKGAQAALALADDGMMFGATLQLIATGGSGDGALSYSLATTGTASCALTGTSVTATTVGTCTVNIAKAASTNYLIKSQIFTITVGVAPQLAISITTASGTVNTSIPLVFTGGSGNGATTWSVTDAGTARCGVIGNTLLASGVGTCSVRITKAAEDNYLVASASRSISITAVVVAPSQGQIATPSVTNAPTTTTSTSTTTTIALAASPTPDSSPRTPAVATTTPEKTSTTTSTVPVQVALLKKLEKVQASSALMMQGDSAFAASVTRVNNSLVMDAGIFKAVIKGMDKEGNVIPLDAKGDLRIPRGGSISVDMGRYLPNSEVFIWMFSTPKSLGERNTDARGNISTRIATPRKIEPGLHRVAFVGKNPAGRDITFMIGLIVADPSTLSTANKILIAIPITMAIFAGFLLPTRVRRRKKLSIAL